MALQTNADAEAVRRVFLQFGVRRLVAFGSAVDGTFNSEHSDVDLLVEFLPNISSRFDAYFELKESLEELFGRPVDLVVRGRQRSSFVRS